MSDVINLQFIGTTLRSIQAEQRTLRMENDLVRKELGRMMGIIGQMATRDELLEVLRVLADRIGNFAALMEARFDQLAAQIASRPDTPT